MAGFIQGRDFCLRTGSRKHTHARSACPPLPPTHALPAPPPLPPAADPDRASASQRAMTHTCSYPCSCGPAAGATGGGAGTVSGSPAGASPWPTTMPGRYSNQVPLSNLKIDDLLLPGVFAQHLAPEELDGSGDTNKWVLGGRQLIALGCHEGQVGERQEEERR